MSYVLPNEIQTTLLQASLLDGVRRERAIARFRQLVDLDDLDSGSHRLLPLYYRRLVEAQIADPDLGRLKGVHRKSWYENLLLRRNGERTLRTLHQAGIETLLMKGAGLHTTVYAHEPALRPLADIDVLVPIAQVDGAIQALTEAGFSRGNGLYGAAWPQYMHSQDYRREAMDRIDLHVRPLRYQFDVDFTKRSWQRRVAVQLGETSTTTMDPTDHLLIAIIHGMAPNLEPPCRWVEDAIFLIRQEVIDWDRFSEDALWLWHPDSVRAGLLYLQGELGADIPDRVFAGLQRSRPVAMRALEQITARPPTLLPRLFRAFIGDYLFACTGAGFISIIRGYPRYVRVRSYRGFRGTIGRIIRLALRGQSAAR